MKKIIMILLIIMSIILIEMITEDKKIYYVSINMNLDNKLRNKEKYINIKNEKDYRITDLINDININKKIKNKTITNHLVKADKLIINIGKNELEYKKFNNKDEMYFYVDEMINDYQILFKVLRKYCKEKIYIVKISNDVGISYQEVFEYLNKRLKELTSKYDIKLIDKKYLKKFTIDNN